MYADPSISHLRKYVINILRNFQESDIVVYVETVNDTRDAVILVNSILFTSANHILHCHLVTTSVIRHVLNQELRVFDGTQGNAV